MSGIEIVLGIVLGLVVNETTELSPWLARAFVGWSARIQYSGTEQAEIRAEELKALINVRPGKLSKLFTGLGFVSSAVLFRIRRFLRPETAATGDPVPEMPVGPSRSLVLEDEPTALVARYLFPSERYRGEWRRHWISLVKSGGIVLIYGVLGVWAVQVRIKPRYVDDLTIWIVVITVLLLLWQFPRWYFNRLMLTNKRLMTTRGVLRRRVEMLPLIRVTDLQYVQSPLGRLLNYGTFENQTERWRKPLRRLHDLPNPNELYLRIVEEMYEPAAVEARLGYDSGDPSDADHDLLALDNLFETWPPAEHDGVAPSAPDDNLTSETRIPAPRRPAGQGSPIDDQLVRHLGALTENVQILVTAVQALTTALPSQAGPPPTAPPDGGGDGARPSRRRVPVGRRRDAAAREAARWRRTLRRSQPSLRQATAESANGAVPPAS
ncbi:PH domain-containing protein [Plantactinospora sp. B5E13]|uniref:PH domain-containing protein n=1 Tax=Plantactinospora sp. B5E13 TaxID=3153758 RepID=UPI00325D09A9